MSSTTSKVTIANLALSKIGAKRITTFPTSNAAAENAEARLIFAVYAEMLDKVLGEHPWSFAQKRKSLAKIITAATQANPVVITCASHGFSNADPVKITGIVGMTELNSNTYYAANVATNTFELQSAVGTNVDGTDYTAYSSGGYARKVVTLEMDEDGMDVVYDKPSDFISISFTSDENSLVKIESHGILSNVEELKIIYTYRNDDPTTYTPGFIEALYTRLAAEICFNLTEGVTKGTVLLEDYEKIKLPAAKSADSQQSSPVQPLQDEWERARISGSGSGISGRTGQSTWHPG